MKFSALHLAVLASLALEANAKPVVPATLTVHERGGQHWARDWKTKTRLPRDAILPVRIGLQQSNEHIGRQRLAEM